MRRGQRHHCRLDEGDGERETEGQQGHIVVVRARHQLSPEVGG